MRFCAIVLALSLATSARSVARADSIRVRASTGPHASQRIESHVRRVLQAHGYGVVLSGRANFVVTPAVTHLAILGAQVECAIELRIAPLDARGRERWDAGRTAIARGRATVTPGGERGASECVQAATLDSLQQRVLPFLAAQEHVAAR